MNELISWVMTSAAGQMTARGVLVLCGLGIWSNLLVLANYLPKEAVPIHSALFIVFGVAAGGGAAHSGFVGDLPAGAIFLGFATAALLCLLIDAVGTPKALCKYYKDGPHEC